MARRTASRATAGGHTDAGLRWADLPLFLAPTARGQPFDSVLHGRLAKTLLEWSVGKKDWLVQLLTVLVLLYHTVTHAR